jgi:DNA-binding LacI/PurR family transcriptional regulator
MISIREVAQAAGVSVTTVSYVLNNRGNISEETRQKVLEVVEKLGYVPRIGAQSLRDNRARIIGYPWNFDYNPRETNNILEEFLHHTMFYVEQRGRHLLLVRAPTEGGLAVYDDLIKSQRIDGFILSHTAPHDERLPHLYKSHFPFVAFGRSMSPLDDVMSWADVDGTGGIRLVVQHLFEQGHRRLAFITWPPGSLPGDERFRGYTETLAELGLSFDPDLVTVAEHRVAAGYQAGQHLMRLPNPPTAIIAVSDTVALGAMQAFRDMGRYAAITGFDDMPIGEFHTPSLTSVQQPIMEIAAILADMLIQQIDEPDTYLPQQHLLLPSLVIRESSLGNYGQ